MNWDRAMRAMDKAIINTLGDDEHVIYRPAGNKPMRCIKGIIDWMPPSSEAGGAVVKFIRIIVRNDCTHGIHPSEIDFGGDRIELSTEKGGKTKKMYSIQLPTISGPWHDAGSVTLDLR